MYFWVPKSWRFVSLGPPNASVDPRREEKKKGKEEERRRKKGREREKGRGVKKRYVCRRKIKNIKNKSFNYILSSVGERRKKERRKKRRKRGRKGRREEKKRKRKGCKHDLKFHKQSESLKVKIKKGFF